MSENPIDRFARDYAAGEVLFREGDAGDVMYVIQSGSIEIRRKVGDQERTLAVLPPGEFFGEMAIVNQRPRSATAIVREPSRLLVIEGRTFEAMLRGRVEIAVRMIKTLAGRLERANEQIELLLLPNANHRVVQCLRMLADQQLAAGDVTTAGEVHIAVDLESLATRVALPPDEVAGVVARLGAAQLVTTYADVGLDGPGFIIPEVGRLLEFLEFLELRHRYASR